MKCAYCSNEAKSTREHIISSSVLDLFPECFLTVDENRKKIYSADPVINDVCADCNNNKLSYIDNYAKGIVQKYFVQSYDADDNVEIDYDYVLLQKVLLKYAYNDLRSNHDDISYFDDDIIRFLLNQDDAAPKKRITILAGLAVNTSPVPDYMFGNLKLRWSKSPMLLANSIIINIDYETGQIFRREHLEVEKFEGLALSYIFRFGSGQFILLCWDKDCPNIETNLNIIQFQYPYEMLSKDSSIVTIARCTDEMTYHLFKLVDVNWGHGLSDEITMMRKLASNTFESGFKEMNAQWKKEEERIAKEHKRY